MSLEGAGCDAVAISIPQNRVILPTHTCKSMTCGSAGGEVERRSCSVILPMLRIRILLNSGEVLVKWNRLCLYQILGLLQLLIHRAPSRAKGLAT